MIPPRTTEKKCPNCGSKNVHPTETSHVVGKGPQRRKSDHFLYECTECTEYNEYDECREPTLFYYQESS